MKIFLSLFFVITLSSQVEAKIGVTAMKLSGGLCSNNDTVISVSDDSETFTAIFNNFYLEANDSVEKGHRRLSWRLTGVKGYKVMNLTPTSEPIASYQDETNLS